MPSSFDPDSDLLVPPETVVAGTLCLMSCYVQHRLPLYAERIANNLQLLARNTDVTREMRTLCHRLAQRWDRIRDDAALHMAAHGAPHDERTMH